MNCMFFDQLLELNTRSDPSFVWGSDVFFLSAAC